MLSSSPSLPVKLAADIKFPDQMRLRLHVARFTCKLLRGPQVSPREKRTAVHLHYHGGAADPRPLQVQMAADQVGSMFWYSFSESSKRCGNNTLMHMSPAY